MQLGKKILAIPLHGQMEQVANAMALEKLEIADVIQKFDREPLAQWLAKPSVAPRRFPNVAAALVRWIQSGMRESADNMAKALWAQTVID